MKHREYIYHRNKKFKVVDNPDKVFKFKTPRCPICDSPVHVTVNAWYMDKWGWVPDQIETECTAMPDILSDEFDDFMNFHYNQPYSDWLPFDVGILYWMQKNVRFTNLKIKHHEKNPDQKKP